MASPAKEPSAHSISPGNRCPPFIDPGPPRIHVSFAAYDPSSDAAGIRISLVEHVTSLLATGTIEELVNKCIDIFMQFIFPNTPVCHEPTLRAGVSVFQLRSSADAVEPPLVARQLEALQQPVIEKTFTLITALCALVMSVAPEPYIPQNSTLALLFLRASRAMLLTYQEHDFEHPDWTSLIIRIWQSSATQNATGKNGEAHHYYGEASMLALRLRLYKETSVARESPLESQLLRSIFWLLYLSDKSAEAFDDRLCIINERVFNGELTLLESSNPAVPLLDMDRITSMPLLESRIQEGFLLKRRIWSAAVDLIAVIESRTWIQAQTSPSQTQTETAAVEANDEAADLSHLTEMYVEFAGLIDSFPPWLRNPDQYLDQHIDADVANYQKMCFWAQRSSIMMSFHTLKLVILQRCINHDAPGAMGLDHSQFSQHLRKIDIGQDFLSELQLVQRLRKVGTILLELAHNASNERIKTRAQSQLVQLLDVLVQLDSRASDELRGRQM
ncbi:hypothetical protein B0O99DRAFT_581287 [Bisporella sp. PMI_857]|nr:hypothetical protein B0O99DRAFT_581287 [Bisporella sp. PMI_857]